MLEYILIIVIVCIIFYVLHTKKIQKQYTYQDTPIIISNFITKEEADYIKANCKAFVKSDIVIDDKITDKYK